MQKKIFALSSQGFSHWHKLHAQNRYFYRLNPNLYIESTAKKTQKNTKLEKAKQELLIVDASGYVRDLQKSNSLYPIGVSQTQ